MLLLFNPGCLVFNPASFISSITLNRGGGGTKSVIIKHDKSYLLLYVDGLFLSLFFLFLFFFSLFFLYLFYFFLFKFRIILFLSETFISQKRKAQDWSLAQSDYRAMGYSPVEKIQIQVTEGVDTAVLAGNDTFLTENITQRFITQSKHVIFW